MSEFVDQAEFEAWLAEAEAQERPKAIPVFVAPKVTDRGFYKRRQAQLKFAGRQMKVSSDLAKVQGQMQALQTQAAATTDPARQEELAQQSFALLERLDDLMAEQAQFVDEQVEFLLSFVRAIKEPLGDGQTFRFRPRPFAEEEQAAFDDEVRPLLRESSQEEFDAMLRAASGQGAGPAVPPT